ncbi:MAG: universal stress protein [Bacteroidia bacterium]
MSKALNQFLIPTDFTAAAECALHHAISVAKVVNAEVTLLHVIDKNGDRVRAQEKLDEIIKANEKYAIALKSVVKEGNIFDDIGGVAETIGANLIFMGTHGVKGMQHILGSYAVKVITNSAVPFVVVQNRPMRNGYSRIVLPMDLTKEGKQKLDLTIRMAGYFKSKIYIFSQFESDEFLKKTVARNTSYAQNEMKKNGIEHEVHSAAEKGGFVKQLISFATSVDADLIAVVNSQERGVHELFSGTAERDIISNEVQIPVMVVNPTVISSAKIASFVAG